MIRNSRRRRTTPLLGRTAGAAAVALLSALTLGPLGPASGPLGPRPAAAADRTPAHAAARPPAGARLDTPSPTADSARPPEPGPMTAGGTPDTAGRRRDGLDAAHRAPFAATPRTAAPADGSARTATPPRPGHPRPSMRRAGGADDRPGSRAECAPEDFGGSTGPALVDLITSSTTACVNTLFSLTGTDARGAFREEQMVTVADALRTGSAGYPGDSSTGMPQLVLYLRAGYYVHWYHGPDVGEYGPALTAAVQGGLDAFFAAEHAWDVTDANGETLAEAVTLIDSAEQNARYLGVVTRLLNSYDSSYDDKWWMLTAVNNVYTVLWRGHQLPEFVDAVRADPTVLTTLHDFAREHLGLLDGERAHLTANAGRELGRFVQHTALRETVRPQLRDLLDATSMTGPTAQLWVGVAEMADAYDRDNCAYYGVCDLRQRLREAVLADRDECSASITVTAQSMAAGDFSAACTSLNGQDAWFHDVAGDRGPVADDRNTRIEVVVFDSSTDYRTYAGVLFGIDTDNGGMYLEGDPSAEGNLPRFIAYEAEWQRPDFRIWNLNHEYTHYLDGRFDMYGDFEAGVSTPTVWWIEGFAEYVSYGYRGLPYEEALEEAGKKTYTLSELFDTTYENGDTTRVYRWGYLAVRYMFAHHPGDVDTVLAAYRTGDWAAARHHLKETIGTRYDAGFASWLDTVAKN